MKYNPNLIPSIDSRNIINPEKTLFFAIKGPQNDAHKYIGELYKSGVRNFIIEDNKFKVNDYSDAIFELVDDSKKAFQEYAIDYRNHFKLNTIGITGSNGKTIVKEWLYQLLENDYTIAKSPRSYNSQVGVPISIFELKSYHNLGIFEAGISLPNEMSILEKIIQPNIGILTNIGTAHDIGFDSQTQKIEEKLELFKNCEVTIYRNDDILVNKVFENKNIDHLTWSLNENKADINFSFIENLEVNSSRFNINNYKINLDFKDSASIENICHCIATLLFLNFKIEDIDSKLKNLTPVKMRMELKPGENNCLLINDSYNNDFIGFKTSLDLFNQNKQLKSRTVILSDIYQSGLSDVDLYKKIDELLNVYNIKHLIGIGKNISANKDSFSCNRSFFIDTEEFLNSDYHFKDEIILIKGSRNFQFEKITKQLSSKQHKAYLDINLTSLIDNLNFYRSKIEEKTKIMVMVKAFAYGSGIEEVANILQYNRVDYLAVAYADEGVRLRKKGINIPIMVMNPDVSDFENIIKYDLEPEIYSLKLIKEWVKYSGITDIKIHLKLDTGMHRLGFEENDLKILTSLINEEKIKIGSVFSHLSTADDNSDFSFSKRQILSFKSTSKYIIENTGQNPLKHILNSSGIINFSQYQYDMVRLGIGLYGVDPTEKSKLKNVTSLHAQISQIKHLKKGDSVGYGGKAILNKDSKIATINIGYADGISRQLGNGKLEVFINKSKVKTFGNICMDMFMVDVTNVECKEGDEVEIFGKNVSIKHISNTLNTIPYEIFTSISERVKRIYYTE